jgi:drug/metabolite transporter (DMT)-like permease
MDSQALPYILLLALLWGTNLVASRFGIGQFDPILFVGLRVALASLFHALVYLVDRRRKWPTDSRLWRRAAVLGVFGTAIPMTSLISSLQYQSSGMTAVFITMAPAFTVLMAHFTLADESLNWRKAAGIGLAFVGGALLAFQGESGLADVSRADPRGFLLVLLGIVVGSGAVIYARKKLMSYDGFDVATIRMWAATAALAPLVFWIGFDFSRVDMWGYFSMGYAAIFATFVGLIMEFYIVQRFGATAAAMTTYIIPVVAIFFGVMLLGETVTAMMIFGMVLIGGGIAIVNRRRQPKRPGTIPPV